MNLKNRLHQFNHSSLTKAWTFFMVCLIGWAVTELYLSNQLGYYIHPSTNLFTLAGAVFLCLCCLYAIKQKHLHLHLGPGQVTLITLTALLLISLKATPLSSSIIEKRPMDESTPTLTRTEVNLSKLTKHYTLVEWLKAWESDPSRTQYFDKEAQLDGFIIYQDDKTYLARLILTCCVVDARPIQIEVQSDQTLPPADTWISAQGTMIGEQKPILNINSYTEIPTPENPYVY